MNLRNIVSMSLNEITKTFQDYMRPNDDYLSDKQSINNNFKQNFYLSTFN
jgi:hypothetical protein